MQYNEQILDQDRWKKADRRCFQEEDVNIFLATFIQCRLKKCSHAWPYFNTLHWQSIEQGIQFKFIFLI